MADDTPMLVAEPSPNEMRDPEMRRELKRAAVWLGLAATMALVVILIQPILIILAGLVFASMLDGGVGLLRTLPTPPEQEVASLRRSALALGLPWPQGKSYGDVLSGLDPALSEDRERLGLGLKAYRILSPRLPR